METDSYRITERNIPAPETWIVLSMSKINALQQQGVIMNQGLCQTIIFGLAEISDIEYSIGFCR